MFCYHTATFRIRTSGDSMIRQPNRLANSRREFLQAASVAAVGLLGPSWASASQERSRANQGRIYIANKGGGIGKDKEAMVATLEEYKRLGFDGIEGKSGDLRHWCAERGDRRDRRAGAWGRRCGALESATV